MNTPATRHEPLFDLSPVPSGLSGPTPDELQLEELREAEARRRAAALLQSQISQQIASPASIADDTAPGPDNRKPRVRVSPSLISAAFGQTHVDQHAFNRISHLEVIENDSWFLVSTPDDSIHIAMFRKEDGTNYVMGKSGITAEIALLRVYAALTNEALQRDGAQFFGPQKDQALMWLAAKDANLNILKAPDIDPIVLRDAEAEWNAYKLSSAFYAATHNVQAPLGSPQTTNIAGLRFDNSGEVASPLTAEAQTSSTSAPPVIFVPTSSADDSFAVAEEFYDFASQLPAGTHVSTDETPKNRLFLQLAANDFDLFIDPEHMPDQEALDSGLAKFVKYAWTDQVDTMIRVGQDQVWQERRKVQASSAAQSDVASEPSSPSSGRAIFRPPTTQPA